MTLISFLPFCYHFLCFVYASLEKDSFLLVLIFFSSSINIYILKYLALNGMAFLGFHAYFQLGVLALCKKIGMGTHTSFYIGLIIPLLICYVLAILVNKYVPRLVGKKSKTFKDTILNL